MSNNRSSRFLGGLLIGTAIGAVSGVLLAPKSGKETRRVLNKSLQAMPELAEDISSNVQLQADRLSENSLRNWEATLKRLREAIAAGVVASQLEQERLNLVSSHDPTANSVTDRRTQPRE
ncbi:YtxH domain-containing protein [Phormidium yuhuli AB48]|uniref:YtxH domain-containing protein n=1 Tax=Phormidium yuhuli AB48 TaxID=2940671 RepID=A0ABY5ALZ4_9CYAN|nr:YtxH domain-containing protein [Phormidium yuhuli]USR89274.1 YtxH domain-containing protein [Phormidium yuhuli AB48]